MNKKIILAILALVVLVVLVLILVFKRPVSPRSSINRETNTNNPYSQQSSSTSSIPSVNEPPEKPPVDPDSVPVTSDYNLKFYDLYGKEVKGKSFVSVNDNTFETQYSVEVENVTPPTGNNKYEVWLQTAEGARTQIGDLKVESNKVGRMSAKGGRPEANWYVLILYRDTEKQEETLVYRAVLEVSN